MQLSFIAFVSFLTKTTAQCPSVPLNGCSICGPDLCVTKPDAVFEFPGQPAVPCGSLESAGSSGEISIDQCDFLPFLPEFTGTCECKAKWDVSKLPTNPKNELLAEPHIDILTFCTEEIKICWEGSTVSRDENNDCHFFSCPVSDLNIISLSEENGTFNTLLTAAQAAGLIDDLNGPGPLTLLAPTDAAFDAFPDGLITCLLESEMGILSKILFYHIVGGNILREDLSGSMTLEMLNNEFITISKTDDGSLIVNNANLLQDDILASNGVIHVLDSVLIPAGVNLENILINCGQGDNDEYNSDGNNYDDNDSDDDNIIYDENENGNLVCAAIIKICWDGSYVHPNTNKNCDFDPCLISDLSIVDLSGMDGSFNTLLTTARVTGLLDDLKGPGPITLLAPNDAAFDTLPDGLIACLLDSDIDALTNILLYHIVKKNFLREELLNVHTMEMLNHEVISIIADRESIIFNDANSLQSDILASNGVIHVIDSVLIPVGVDLNLILSNCAKGEEVEKGDDDESNGKSGKDGKKRSFR